MHDFVFPGTQGINGIGQAVLGCPLLYCQFDGIPGFCEFGFDRYPVKTGYLVPQQGKSVADLFQGIPEVHFAEILKICSEFFKQIQGHIRKRAKNPSDQIQAAANKIGHELQNTEDTGQTLSQFAQAAFRIARDPKPGFHSVNQILETIGNGPQFLAVELAEYAVPGSADRRSDFLKKIKKLHEAGDHYLTSVCLSLGNFLPRFSDLASGIVILDVPNPDVLALMPFALPVLKHASPFGESGVP